MLSKVRHYVPKEELKSIYHAIFSSHKYLMSYVMSYVMSNILVCMASQFDVEQITMSYIIH